MAAVSLSDLLQEVGMSEQQLDCSVSDDQLLKMSVFLTCRERLSPSLGLNEADAEVVEKEGRGEEDKRLKTLQRWKGKYAFKATYRKLVEALLSLEMASHAEKVCRLLQLEATCSVKPAVSETVVIAMENQQQINAQFVKLQMLVCEKLQTMNINMQKFHYFIKGLFQRANFIPASKKIDDIFEAITRNRLWDFINYRPLALIAEAFARDDEEINTSMDRYRSALAGYFTATKLANHIASIHPTSEDESEPPCARRDDRYFHKLTTKLKAKVTEKSMDYLIELWDSVSQYLGLPSLMYLLDEIHEGCISVTWLIPPSAMPAIILKIDDPETAKFFSKLAIIRMEVDDMCLFEEQKQSVETATKQKQEQDSSLEQLPDSQDIEASQDVTKETTEQKQKTEEENGKLRETNAQYKVDIGKLREKVTKVECMLSQTQEFSKKKEEKNGELRDTINHYEVETRQWREKVTELECMLNQTKDEAQQLRERLQQTTVKQEFKQTTEEQEISTVESTHDLVEATPMKLANEKSPPHPSSPPEIHQHSQPPHPPGYDVELVKEDPDLHCPICLLILHDPVQVTCCGKRFCRACIDVLVTKAKPCPACNCKAGDFDIFEDKATKQNILEVRVHCSNRKQGCGWKGEFCQLDSHLNLHPKMGKIDLGCQYVQLKCIHCSENCQRHHMRSCPQQLYTCPYCKHYSSTYENVSKQHLSECGEFPIQCNMCSIKVLQKNIQQHESGCSKNQDLQQSTAMPLKSDIIETPSPVFIPPPTFVMNDFTSYKENRESWFSPPFYSHIGGYKLCLSVDAHGLGECSGTHVSVYMHLQCGEYDDSLAWPFTGSVTIQLFNRRRDEGHMERTLSFNERTPAKITSHAAEGERGQGWGYNNFMPNSALRYDEKWNTEYLTNNDSIEFRITQVKLSMTAEGLPTEVYDSIPPVNIIMNNFSTHKICDDSWFSPPFYSHTGGYKMCLSIHANGNKSGAGTHTSVFVRLMRGEYDDKLKWPFTGDIVIQLVNQRKNKEPHDDIVERPINFTESASADRVTEGERGSGIGLFQFVSHSALYCAESSSPSYLKNDCLEFRITHVKLTN